MSDFRVSDDSFFGSIWQCLCKRFKVCDELLRGSSPLLGCGFGLLYARKEGGVFDDSLVLF